MTQPESELDPILRRLDRQDELLERLERRLAALEQNEGSAALPTPQERVARWAAARDAIVAQAEANAGAATIPATIVPSTPPPSRPIPPPPPPRVEYRAPLPPPPPRTPASPSTPPSPPLTDRLRRYGLLPPETTGSFESQIGAWWLTRIGMLLGCIGLAFFGTYVSRFSPPWLRFLELVAVSLAIAGGGLWVGRRVPRYGAVIFGGGLSMLYFAAWGAYALPAIRILDEPQAGMLLQLFVVTGIAAAAIWRRSPDVALLAVFYGYVAAFFAARAGLGGSASTAVLVLSAAAWGFHFARGWWRPLLVAMPANWLILFLVLVFHWNAATTTYSAAIFWPAFIMAAVIAADWRAARVSPIPRKPRLFIQYANSSGAIALALLITAAIGPRHFSDTYFLFGSILLAAALLHYATAGDFNLLHGFFIKGTSLFTLGMVTALEGGTRWIALALQAAVLLGSAWRSRLKVTEGAMVLVWLVALALLARDLLGPGADRDSLNILAPVFLVISTATLGLYGRFFVAGSGSETRTRLGTALAAALGLATSLVVWSLAPAAWHALILTAAATALALAALPVRHWIPLVAAAFPLLLAHALAWSRPPSPSDPGWILVANIGPLAAVTFAVALAAAGRWVRAGNQPDARAVSLCHAFWLAVLVVIPWRLASLNLFYPAALGLAALATVLALTPRIRLDPRLIGLPVAIALLLWFADRTYAPGPWLPVDESRSLFWLALGGAYAMLVAAGAWQPLRRILKTESLILLTAALILLVQALLLQLYSGPGLMLAHALAAGAIGLLAWRPRLVNAPSAALYLLFWANLLFYRQAVPLSPGIIVALLTLAAGPLAQLLREPPSRATLTRLQWITAAAALVLADLLFLRQRGALAPYVTIFWGLSALTVFITGFLAGARPLRIVGLAGLALCTGRAFVVDIRSTFERIIAFLALGGVLLGVGYLYHRYQRMIDRPLPPG